MEVMKSVWRWWWWGLASYEIGGFTGTGRKKDSDTAACVCDTEHNACETMK